MPNPDHHIRSDSPETAPIEMTKQKESWLRRGVTAEGSNEAAGDLRNVGLSEAN